MSDCMRLLQGSFRFEDVQMSSIVSANAPTISGHVEQARLGV